MPSSTWSGLLFRTYSSGPSNLVRNVWFGLCVYIIQGPGVSSHGLWQYQEQQQQIVFPLQTLSASDGMIGKHQAHEHSVWHVSLW